MTRNKTVRAVFATTLTTTVSGSGSITTYPLSPWYPYGTQLRLTGIPSTGNYLASWDGYAEGLTNNPLVLTVTNPSPTATAVFASLGGTDANALTVICDGLGQVTLTPPGNCFPLNTRVALRALPHMSQAFLGWSGDASGSQNPLTVTMDASKVIKASFTKRPQLQVGSAIEGLFPEGFRLTLSGEFGRCYEILGSTDFSDWLPVGAVTNTYGSAQFTDPAGTNFAWRFYRTTEAPRPGLAAQP